MTCRSVPQSKTDTCRGSYAIPRVPHPSPKTDTPAASTTRVTTHTRDGPTRSTTTPRMSAALSRLAANARHLRPTAAPPARALHRCPWPDATATADDSRRTATACTHRTHTREERPRSTGQDTYHSFSTQSSRRTLLPQLLHAELETVFRVGTEFHEIADDALDTRREDDQSLPLHAICHLGLNANDGQPTPHALARL